MPFTGGYSPSPEKTGGGDGTGAAPLLQRVFESIAAARGEGYDQTLNSAVGAENVALARAVTFDLYGTNARFANEMNPGNATVAGLLPRWEKIFATPALPGDTEPVRQARVSAAAARFGVASTLQQVTTQLQAILGPLFQGLTLFTPANAQRWWPAYGGTAAYVASVAGNLVTIGALTQVPTSAPLASLTCSNCVHTGNVGTFPIKQWLSPTSVVIVNNGVPVAPDYGVFGFGPGSPAIKWTMPNLATPWTSTISRFMVQVNPTAVAGYVNADGTVNGAFYSKVAQMNPYLDWALPADSDYGFYITSGFVLDAPNNLDLSTFGS